MRKIKLLFPIFLATSIMGCSSNNGKVVSLTVDASNAKTIYVTDSPLKTDNLVITATYENGKTETIKPEKCNFNKPPFSAKGNKEVEVEYQGVKATYPIVVASTCAESGNFITYDIRENENGSKVQLVSSLVGENKPFCLIFPGGGYQEVYMQQEGFEYAAKMNERGYNAFILKYSVKMAYPAPHDDVDFAYRLINQNKEFFNVDVKDYMVCGSSAGGHLAATWATKSVGYAHYGLPKPGGVILCYSANHMSSSENFFIGDKPNEELRKKLSADENVDADYPKTYMWHFDRDESCDVENAYVMDEALNKYNVPHLTHIFSGEGMTKCHGLGLAKGTVAEGWMDECFDYFEGKITK